MSGTNLLDFPPEVFQRIIDMMVSQIGVKMTWALRSVCHTFANEIEYNVLTLQPMGCFKGHGPWDFGIMLCPFNHDQLAVLLFNRIKMPLDAHSDLLDAVRDIAQIWSKHMDDTASLTSSESLESICTAVCKVCSQYNKEALMYTLLGGFAFDAVEASKQAAASVAMVAGKVYLARKIVSSLKIDDLREHPPFGNLLHWTIKFGSSDDVQTILNLKDSLRSQKPENTGQSLVYHSKNGPILGSRSVSNAIILAINEKDTTKLSALLAFDRSERKYAIKSSYHEWIESAIISGNVGILDIILRVPCKSPPRVLKDNFALACAKGNGTIVSALLGKGKVKINTPWSESPLCMSISSGRYDSVKALLEAGACASGSDTSSPKARLPIAVAIDNHSDSSKPEIVRLLLEYGAMDRDPTKGYDVLSFAHKWGTKDTYEIIRAFVEKHGDE